VRWRVTGCAFHAVCGGGALLFVFFRDFGNLSLQVLTPKYLHHLVTLEGLQNRVTVIPALILFGEMIEKPGWSWGAGYLADLTAATPLDNGRDSEGLGWPAWSVELYLVCTPYKTVSLCWMLHIHTCTLCALPPPLQSAAPPSNVLLPPSKSPPPPKYNSLITGKSWLESLPTYLGTVLCFWGGGGVGGGGLKGGGLWRRRGRPRHRQGCGVEETPLQLACAHRTALDARNAQTLVLSVSLYPSPPHTHTQRNHLWNPSQQPWASP
jgi:hypothetical protein